MTINPASKVLFCKPDSVEAKTTSGFLIPEKAAQIPQFAEVINIGDGVTSYKSKDRIVYKSYTTSDINLQGVDYFLIAEEDILGTVVES